jgi:hypothetical protein
MDRTRLLFLTVLAASFLGRANGESNVTTTQTIKEQKPTKKGPMK